MPDPWAEYNDDDVPASVRAELVKRTDMREEFMAFLRSYDPADLDAVLEVVIAVGLRMRACRSEDRGTLAMAFTRLMLGTMEMVAASSPEVRELGKVPTPGGRDG